MFLRLANTPRPYAWGSLSGISDLLGTRPSGRPEAELWFGTHGGSPTWLVDHDEGYATLNELVFSQPERMISRGDRLPFLLKVLAADKPLSLQAHPTAAQAREGFARENAAGIRLDSPDRNYRDDQAKPELIVCVSEEFVGLSGFRPLARTIEQFAQLLADDDSAPKLRAFLADFDKQLHKDHDEALAWAVSHLLGPSSDGTAVARELIALAREYDGSQLEIVDTVRDLASEYPDDAGVVLATLLNRVSLRRGEAMYLPAGNLHAYLRGVGIELMNASDNVLRGGLTSKHVDVDELLRIMTCEELSEVRLATSSITPELNCYRPPTAGFALYRFASESETTSAAARVPIDEAAIVLCTSGSIRLRGKTGDMQVNRGEAVFASADEQFLICDGRGEAFIATSVG